MADYAKLTQLNVVTGFLGSGKTTLLQGLLTSPRLQDTAVLINEFGEVGLDHQLLQHVSESTLLLDNGCLCCAVRGDLQKALRDLLSQRTRGEVPYFARVVIETSGLADPVPIAYTLLADPVIQHHFRLGNIVTTVDAVTAGRILDSYPESVKQIAVADRLILTKVDMADAQDVAALHNRLRRLNASAPILQLEPGAMPDDTLLLDDIYEADGKSREIDHWLKASANVEPDGLKHEHGSDVHSFTIRFDRPLDWTAFGIWLTMLLNRHGENVLRVKGLLNIVDVATPVLINGVQHIVHPPSHLDAWPDEDRRSRLIFIVHALDEGAIRASLDVFNELANPGERNRPNWSRHPTDAPQSAGTR
jgi:G3E family GTPase